MDNRITRERLYNTMSYEWVLIIIILLVGILVFEFFFNFFSVQLTTGQKFKYYYDVNVDQTLEGGLIDVLFDYEKPTFSYDVLLVNGEVVKDEENLLSSRMRIQEGDIIISDVKVEEDNSVRAKSIIDSDIEIPIYHFEKLLLDGRKYLNKFLKDEYLTLSPEEQLEKTKDKDNFSTDKIDQAFLLRMKKDNRFRTEEQKSLGKTYERERIFRLVKELNDFSLLLEVGDEHGLLYRYTKFTQRKEFASSDETKQLYDNLVNAEINAGKENVAYALKVENLKGGKHSPSEFFKLTDGADAKDVVIMVFDFLSYQEELQFETVCYINSIVRACSDIFEKEYI